MTNDEKRARALELVHAVQQLLDDVDALVGGLQLDQAVERVADLEAELSPDE